MPRLFGAASTRVRLAEISSSLLRWCFVHRELDQISDRRARMEAALRGVFAGNIFDLGAAASSDLFNSAGGVRPLPGHPVD